MELNVKQQILKYFKTCIEEDSKENLKIDLDKLENIIFPNDEDINYYNYIDIDYNIHNLNLFYETLKIKINNFDNDFLIGFYNKALQDFNKTKYSINKGGKYELNKFISYEDNSLRLELLILLKIIPKIHNLKLDYLKNNDLKELFYSPDKGKNGISKIEFKPTLSFIEFYNKNKKESFYLVLEYIYTKDQDQDGNQKKNTVIPLYLIELEIEQNDNGGFILSLKNIEPDFLYNIRNKNNKSIFPFYSRNRGDEGTKEIQELEENIKGMNSLKSKIEYYKSKISGGINQKEEFIYNPCIISGLNNIKYIKSLIQDYSGIIYDQGLEKNNKLYDLENSSLGFLFGEKKFETNNNSINKFINITELNKEQEIIIKESLKQNISTIIGPPGTGKSQIVLNLLANLYINNKTVVFASKNNPAVDTVIDKLDKLELSYYPFLRLGNQKVSEKWLGKIQERLGNTKGVHKVYKYSDIENKQNVIKGLYGDIENIENKYLEYYEEYEKFELLLNELTDSKLKNILYKVLPFDIPFLLLKKEFNKYGKILDDLEKQKNIIADFQNKISLTEKEVIKLGGKKTIKNINKINDVENLTNFYINEYNTFIRKNKKLDSELNIFNNDKLHNESKIEQTISNLKYFIVDKNNRGKFLEIIDENSGNYDEVLKFFKKNKEDLEKNLILLNKYKRNLNKDFLSDKDELKGILFEGNFINYDNDLNNKIDNIKRGLLEISNYGFFKELYKNIFGIKKDEFNFLYNNFRKIINLQKNKKIKNYFLNIRQDKLYDSTDIIDKINMISGLTSYEENFNFYEHYTSNIVDNKKNITYIKNKYRSIFGKYFFKNIKDNSIFLNDLKYINKLSEEYINLLHISENIITINKNINSNIDIISLFINNLGNSIFIDLKGKEHNEILKILSNIITLYLQYNEQKENNMELTNIIELKNNIEKYININYIKKLNNSFIKYLDKNNENFSEKLNTILILEEISNVRVNIEKSALNLKNIKSDITIINKKISDNQSILKELSKNYLSSKIHDFIIDKKPIIKDSIDGIYNAYRKSPNKTKEGKDKFLKEMFKKLFGKINIFITTNQSTANFPLTKSFYDYLIIDEASQNDLASIVPLLYRCKNVIIIGDPNQLQNITKLDEKKSKQLFKQKLSEIGIKDDSYEVGFKNIYNYGKSKDYNLSAFNSFNHIYKGIFNKETFKLINHYRCYPDIINFSNEIINDYNLFPKSYIKNEKINNLKTPLGIHWYRDIKSSSKEKTNQNEAEAKAIIEYLKEILSLYGENVSIGIISPYRNQVNLLNSYFMSSGLEEYNKVVLIDSVHRFQGDEKDIILYSPVFPKCKGLWNDKNLLNVAVSRARSSFLIFGDKFAISNAKDKLGNNLLLDLINYIDKIDNKNKQIKINKFDTEYEKIFFDALKKANIKFDFHSNINGGEYELDFKLKLKGSNSYINIELDGSSHDNQQSYDYTRNRTVEKLGNTVIRYSNGYMIENIGEIIDGLKKVCEIDNIKKPIKSKNKNFEIIEYIEGGKKAKVKLNGEDIVIIGKKILEGIDIESLRIIDNQFFVDKLYVYYIDFENHYGKENLNSIFILEGADPKTFEVMEGNHFKDINSVYITYIVPYDKSNTIYIEKIEGADPKTFRGLNYEYSSDDKNIYDKYGKIIEVADSKTDDINYLEKKLSNNKKYILRLMNTKGEGLYFASDTLKKDKNFILKYIIEYAHYYTRKMGEENDEPLYCYEWGDDDDESEEYVDILVHFKNDKPFLLEVIKINPYLIKLMPEELKNDKGFVMTVMDIIKNENMDIFKYIGEKLKNDKDLLEYKSAIEFEELEKNCLEYVEKSI